MKRINILVLVTHSLGELDVLFPLFSRSRGKLTITLVFTVSKLYQQFLSSEFYQYCAKQLDVSTSFILLPNKFDDGFRKYQANRIGARAISVFFLFLKIVQYPRLVSHLLKASAYMHEISNQYSSTAPLYWGKRLIGKPIYTYDHGHAIRLCQATPIRIPERRDVNNLIFHEHNRATSYAQGFEQQIVVGYPKFSKEWHELLDNYDWERPANKYVLIYSRGVHPIWMDEDKYDLLLTGSYRTVRDKLGDCEIFIKPHPRESSKRLIELIESQDMYGVTITTENAGVLAKGALFAISFFSSAILDALAAQIPAVEYFIEPNRFRELEPNGSSYKYLGIDAVDNEQELGRFIDKVTSGNYQEPDIITSLSSTLNHDLADIII